MSEAATKLADLVPARPRLTDGTLEAVKWLALLLMTGDHINMFLNGAKAEWMFDLARVVMPLFGFVLAYNLTRAEGDAAARRTRTLRRLVLFAALATPAAYVLHEGLWPGNVLWLLAAATLCIHCLELGTRRALAAAVVAFVVLGAWAEFFWMGILYCVGAYFYCKRPSWSSLSMWVAGCFALGVINGNHWALLALPIIFAADRIRLDAPRFRWAFYAYYPLHLSAIAAVQAFIH